MVDPRPIDPAAVDANLSAVRARIVEAGGDVASVAVLAVTKGFGADAASAAAAVGLLDLGENYAQELLAKASDPDLRARGDVRWHFIGRLQSNKVRSLAAHVSCWQSVDRPSLVAEIAEHAPGARVLIQVNATDEPTKGGVERAGVDALVDRAAAVGLQVEGLMAVGSAGSRDETRRAFDWVVATADRLALPVRSLGMSADLEDAVRAGSTMVRIGTALFGTRPAR